MDTFQIQSLIARSRILTDAERTYWQASISKMSPEQLKKLESILTKAEKIPWTEQVQKYFSLITKAAQKVA